MKNRSEIEVFLGGESACYAHLLCETCGGVLGESRHELCGTDDHRATQTNVDEERLPDVTTR